MVIKRNNGIDGTAAENIKLPIWLDNLITKKWFLYVMVLLVLGSMIYLSPAWTPLTKALSDTSTTDLTTSGTDVGKTINNGNILINITSTPTPVATITQTAVAPKTTTQTVTAPKTQTQLILEASQKRRIPGLTRAEIARQSIPNVDTDWKTTCTSANEIGGCEQFEYVYIGPECAIWNNNQTVCLKYADGATRPTVTATTAVVYQQNNKATPAADGSWQIIDGKPKDITPNEFSTVVSITVLANGRIDAALKDENLILQHKAIGIKIYIKDKAGNIFETDESVIGRVGMAGTIGDWTSIAGNSNPENLQWQAKFNVVER